MVETTLSPVKNSSLAVQVFETIRAAIFAGELQPGDALREAHLARQMQVSQVPVREALLQLEQVGLVTRVRNKSTHVTKLSKEEIEQRLAVRRHLEEMAFTEAARRMTDESFEELNLLTEAISTAVINNKYFEAAQADLEFHRYIWKQSGNEALYDTLDRLGVQIYAFVSVLRRRGEEELKQTTASHEEIVIALKSRDAETIRETIRQHHALSKAIPKSVR